MTDQTTLEGATAAKPSITALDLEYFPTQVALIPMDSPFRQRVRRLADRIGRKEADLRVWRRDIRPLGIHNLTAKVKAAMDTERLGQVCDYSEIRRRFNELADARYYYPTPWLHLEKKFVDVDPTTRIADQHRPMSAYVPNPEVYASYQGIFDRFMVARLPDFAEGVKA